MSNTSESTGDGKVLFSVDLVEDERELGESKTDKGRNIFQRRASGLVVVIREKFAVHGTWPDRHASLIVLNMELAGHSSSRSRRFEFVKSTFRFESSSGRARDSPKIESYAPASNGKIGFIPTAVVRSRKKTVEGGADGGSLPIPVPINLNAGFEDSWEWDEDVKSTLSGIARKSSYDYDDDDTVEWSLRENRQLKEIPDRYTLAILIGRPNDDDFVMHFDIEVEAGPIHAVASGVKSLADKLFGGQKSSVKYSPKSVTPGTTLSPEGVTTNALGKLYGGDHLDKIVFTHSPQTMQVVKID